jgi:hypothetical protein
LIANNESECKRVDKKICDEDALTAFYIQESSMSITSSFVDIEANASFEADGARPREL